MTLMLSSEQWPFGTLTLVLYSEHTPTPRQRHWCVCVKPVLNTLFVIHNSEFRDTETVYEQVWGCEFT